MITTEFIHNAFGVMELPEVVELERKMTIAYRKLQAKRRQRDQEWEQMLPFIRIISERHRCLERFEERLHTDPRYLEYLYNVM